MFVMAPSAVSTPHLTYCLCCMLTAKLSLSTSWKRIGGTAVYLHWFLTSALDGGEWSTSRLRRFTPGKGPGIHWVGGWVGPWSTTGIRTPDRPIRSVVLSVGTALLRFLIAACYVCMCITCLQESVCDQHCLYNHHQHTATPSIVVNCTLSGRPSLRLCKANVIYHA